MIDSKTERLELPVLTSTPTPLEMSKIVLDWAIGHPANHRQRSWGEHDPECGTTLCIAGTACVVDPNTEVRWRWDGSEMSSYVGVTTTRADGSISTVDHVIESRGAQLLGLDTETADELFCDTDSREAKAMLSEHISKLEAEQFNAISCPKCRKVSHNPNDVEQRYCGHCHQYHDVLLAQMDARLTQMDARWP